MEVTLPHYTALVELYIVLFKCSTVPPPLQYTTVSLDLYNARSHELLDLGHDHGVSLVLGGCPRVFLEVLQHLQRAKTRDGRADSLLRTH